MTKLPVALWTALQDRWFWPLFAGEETELREVEGLVQEHRLMNSVKI